MVRSGTTQTPAKSDRRLTDLACWCVDIQEETVFVPRYEGDANPRQPRPRTCGAESAGGHDGPVNGGCCGGSPAQRADWRGGISYATSWSAHAGWRGGVEPHVRTLSRCSSPLSRLPRPCRRRSRGRLLVEGLLLPHLQESKRLGRRMVPRRGRRRRVNERPW